MKIKNIDKFLEENVQIQMMDNGHWEYERVGVGVLDSKVFVCDLEALDEEDFDWFWFVKFDSVDECIKSGLESGWCEEWKESEGYGVDDRYRFKIEDEVVIDEVFEKWVKEKRA